MAGKRVRSRVSQNSVPVTNLTNRPVTTTTTTAASNLASRPKDPPDGLLALTKEQLKVECRKRGQKTTGTKNELLQRLGHKMMSSSSSNKRTAVSTSNGSAMVENVASHQQAEALLLHRNKQLEKEERQNLVLWKRPLVTLEYFAKEVFLLLVTYGRKLREFKTTVLLVVISLLALIAVARLGGPHEKLVRDVYNKLLWCLYWTGLGILSSVGLGTGLHTFLLYLGPHIAQVTLAAYECGSLKFPEPPYPDEIVCPTESDPLSVSIFAIMSKVRLEAMCWGAGTALGELPPYFMARAARLSGIDPDDGDDDLAEFEQLQRKRKDELTLIEQGKLFIEEIVQKVGFLGILACASIPNPLFDLAGITCGHFLVPFWTFFGATLIGKAIIKMHIQKMFVIIAFNEALIQTALSWLELVPFVGASLQVPFKAFLDGQKLKLHGKKGSADAVEKGSILGSVFEKFVIAMILYFVISLVNSLAQSHHKRLHKKKKSA